MFQRVKTGAKGQVWVSYVYDGKDENGKRREIALGSDLLEAKRKWAELEGRKAPAEVGTMCGIFDRYERDVIPGKSPRSQKDNAGELKRLRAVFDNAPINSIEPYHIAQYLENRAAKTRGNREISLLSHVWNKARAWGYTSKANPCIGIEKNKESRRSYYADEAVFAAVYKHACIELQDAMDLAYLTAQRVSDVREMMLTDMVGDGLLVTPNKTKNSSAKKVRILLKENGVLTELGILVEKIKNRPRKVKSLYIIATPMGAKLTKWTLRARWDKARKLAADAIRDENPEFAEHIREFQFKDIRPKAASETDLAHAQVLLGHTKEQITKVVYQRVGETVRPTK